MSESKIALRTIHHGMAWIGRGRPSVRARSSLRWRATHLGLFPRFMGSCPHDFRVRFGGCRGRHRATRHHRTIVSRSHDNRRVGDRGHRFARTECRRLKEFVLVHRHQEEGHTFLLCSSTKPRRAASAWMFVDRKKVLNTEEERRTARATKEAAMRFARSAISFFLRGTPWFSVVSVLNTLRRHQPAQALPSSHGSLRRPSNATVASVAHTTGRAISGHRYLANNCFYLLLGP
jgi:hypothetical protein